MFNLLTKFQNIYYCEIVAEPQSLFLVVYNRKHNNIITIEWLKVVKSVY